MAVRIAPSGYAMSMHRRTIVSVCSQDFMNLQLFYSSMTEVSPLISVIIPIYNAQEYLNACVESIRNQSFKNYEVILVDDGSVDNSAELCKVLCGNDSRMLYYYKENGGVSSARNYGLGIARGEYIKFMDSDDTMPRNALEDLLSGVRKNTSDIVFGKYRIISSEGITVRKKEIDLSGKPELIKSLLSSVDTAVWDCLFRKDLIIDIGFSQNLSVGEDFRFLVEAFDRARIITYIDKVVYNYNRMNVSSVLSSGKTKEILKKKSDAYNSIREYFISGSTYRIYEEELSKRCLISIQEMALYNDLHSIFLKCVPEKRKYIKKTELTHKIKLLILLLCNKMGLVVELYNMLRGIKKCMKR